MEEPTVRIIKDPAQTLKIGAFSAIAFAAALLIGLAVPKATGSMQLQLPSGVSGRNCYQVARSAHLLHKQLTGAALGTYYAAWVKQLAASKLITRTTLFDAGIAVSVCMKAT